MRWIEVVFWICVTATAYPYLIYPAILAISNCAWRRRLPVGDQDHEPTVTVICPVHNEIAAIRSKVSNLLEIDYPHDKMQILIVGDGCTDGTLAAADVCGGGRLVLVSLPERGGKAAALNAGLQRANGDAIVFTDVGIRIEAGAIRALVRHFANGAIGCVSGEDFVESDSGEGLYGRFELLLRREEAKFHSIAGASGCLYAIRHSVSQPFHPGMAPDFTSVLDTVRAGFRATCEPAARGTMTSTPHPGAEFERKTRTFLRGIAAVFGQSSLLNPMRYPAFSFILVSHKLMRWMGPYFLLGSLVTSLLLQYLLLYRIAFFLQAAFYVLAATGLASRRLSATSAIVRAASYFLLVNLAAARALGLWLAGERREVWEPTQRSA